MAGILQGVGFRPTMARIVAEYGLGGWVRNQSGSVRLCLCGDTDVIERFIDDLSDNLPVQAHLESIQRVSSEALPDDYCATGLEIRQSSASQDMRISIPADLVICDSCKEEVLSEDSRFYGYPFTSCTDCGPRYTVVSGMPYDRQLTSLKEFPLCGECLKEYTDPLNRRFHAETIACAACGPVLQLLNSNGDVVEGDAMQNARAALAGGKIVAVKGLGGFLLAADAFSVNAVARLRKRKNRPAKPFAVMAKNLEVAEKYCEIDQTQAAAMQDATAPIVILELREKYRHNAAFNLIAPGSSTLGVMLPTTPIHLLLAHALRGDSTQDLDLLIMTSGNRGGEPICITNDEALSKLSSFTDLFLCHNRDINFRCDDSISIMSAGKMRVMRRARGFAPRSLSLESPLSGSYLAFGADLKNTIALGFDSEVVLSPHIGDLESPVALDGASHVLSTFPQYFNVEPQTVIVDLHPDMHSTRLGRRYAKERGLPVLEVQHHHAHAAACMAEYGIDESLALVFDGTGFGTDGKIWGGELLHVSPGTFARLGTMAQSPLLGGDVAVRNPARQLIARWLDAGVKIDAAWLKRLNITAKELDIWTIQHKRKINAVGTCAAGRIFDAFSIMLGIAPCEVTFEGQAAIWMESVARRARESAEVSFTTTVNDEMIIVDFEQAFSRFADALPPENQTAALAMGFHLAIIEAGLKMAVFGREITGCTKVVLSGGVMMNRLVAEGLLTSLKNNGFNVFLPTRAPVNDGGISFGQIYVVNQN